ncbi:MAG: glycerate kinase [Candidatus Sumerlaeota bacterium]|nr:glycerate kinase [Candidatus Sumerlaeota bacterium]
MKVVFAPNAFKESLDAPEVARAMAKGWKRVLSDTEAVEAPVADGGDGTARAFAAAVGGRLETRAVRGPLGPKVRARFAWNPKDRTAVIEMVQASGLRHVPPAKRNPMKTTTAGSGELVAAALRLGARRVVIGLGGSATVEGGAGFAAALGFQMLDQRGRPIGPGGKGLERLARIVPPEKPLWRSDTEFLAATDVDNPLLGPRGAAAVFGPQKGATPEQVKRLEAALANYAAILERDLGRKVARLAGAGAAGGFGAGLAGLLGARIVLGIETFLDLINFDEKLKGAGLVFTGEGRLDRQTAYGKAPMGVAKRAGKAGVPVVALAGSLGEGYETLLKKGFAALFSIVPGPMELEEAMKSASLYLERQSAAVAQTFALGLIAFVSRFSSRGGFRGRGRLRPHS